MDALKTFIIFFLIAFALFFLVGFLAGRGKTRSPGYVEDSVFEDVEVVKKEKSYFLVYKHAGKELYAFDVDRNLLVPSSAANERNARDASRPTTISMIDGELISSLLGGSTAAWTVKDVIAVVGKKKSSWQLMGAVLGGISGYSAGHSVATRNRPGWEMFEVREILRDESKWRQRERWIYDRIWDAAKRRAELITDSQVSEELEELLREGLDDLNRFERGVTSWDFLPLMVMEEFLVEVPKFGSKIDRTISRIGQWSAFVYGCLLTLVCMGIL